MSLVDAEATCPSCGEKFTVTVRVRTDEDCSAISPDGQRSCDLKDGHLAKAKHEASWTDQNGEKHTVRWTESEGLEASR